MNPKPLESLNHLTVPVSTDELPPSCELKLTEMCNKKTARRKVLAVLPTKTSGTSGEHYATTGSLCQAFFIYFLRLLRSVTALLRKLVSVLSFPIGEGLAEVVVEEVPCAGMDRPRALFEIAAKFAENYLTIKGFFYTVIQCAYSIIPDHKRSVRYRTSLLYISAHFVPRYENIEGGRS
jgi:hypothetical protein